MPTTCDDFLMKYICPPEMKEMPGILDFLRNRLYRKLEEIYSNEKIAYDTHQARDRFDNFLTRVLLDPSDCIEVRVDKYMDMREDAVENVRDEFLEVLKEMDPGLFEE